MLTPVRPGKQDPRYTEKLKRFQQDQDDQRRHPDNWGFVHPPQAPPPRRKRITARKAAS